MLIFKRTEQLMKYIITILLLSLACASQSQTFINRSGAANTVIDQRLGAAQNFFLPRLIDTTLSGGLDSIGNLIYDRLRAKIAIRDTVLTGGHKFTFLFKQDDTISTLATKYALSLVNNGLSRNNDTTQLGQSIGASGNPAALHNSREIPLNGFSTVFTGTGSIGIGTAAPSASWKMSVTASGTTGGINVSTNTATGINVTSASKAIEAQTSGVVAAITGSTTGGAGSYGMEGSGGIGGIGGRFYTIAAGSDASPVALELERLPTGGGVGNGAGFTIMMRNSFTNGTSGNESGRITNYFSNAVSGLQSSAFGFHLVNNAVSARKALLASSGQWTWDGYPALTAQTDSTTYKPVGIDGSGNVVKMANWFGSGGGSSTWDEVMALGGRFSANRSFSMAQRMVLFDSASIHLGNVDSTGLSFDLAKAGSMIKFEKPAGVARTYAGSTPFRFLMEHTVDDVPGETNNPVKWGWNVNRADSTNAAGIWYSMEPNYRPGGAKWLETILEVSLPGGSIHNSRLFMSTFKINSDQIETSENQWDFRGTGWAFMNLASTIGYVSMGQGTLNVNNTTAASTNFSISNGPDLGGFDMAPGTGTLDYSGTNFQVSGELNTFVHNGSSTGRAGIRFVGDGGTTTYLIKYNSLWAAQTDMRNAIALAAVDGLTTSLALKADGTAWLGDILAYTTGTQKVNISGTLALRGIGTTTTAPEFVVRMTDSAARGISVANAATLLGVGVGTTTNDNAAAGNIGEEFNSTVSTYTNYSTTATYQNIASITLTAGDWDLSAFFTYSTNSATITAGADAIFVISTTTASAAGATEGKNIAYIAQASLLGTSHFSDAISPYRVSISSTTTYYLNTQATFTLGNPQYVGGLRARRIR